MTTCEEGPGRWDYAAHPWQYIAVLGDNYRSDTVGELGGFTTAGNAVDAAIAVLGKLVGEVAALPNADWTTDLPAAVVTGFTIERYDGKETDGSWSLNGGLKLKKELRNMVNDSQRTEAAAQVQSALEHWGMTDVTTDPNDPTTLYATLRSPNTSRVFTATVVIKDAKEI